ncbi:MAG: hypothetical protein F4X36_16530 [Gammaproteobacteria bacterium]|nr:hypothetical protein [Gammaproteobacteria bacterium]
MAEPTSASNSAIASAADAARRNRKPLTAAIGACAAVLVAALAIPVTPPDAGDPSTRGSLAGEPTTVAPAEDLAAFAASRRWGGDTFDELEARRRAAQADADADVARRDRMGFIGTTATPDDRVVLLTLPGGEVARVPPGGTLPDGRTVSAADGTTLTLSASPGDDEEIELFPRIIEAAPSAPEESEPVVNEDGTVEPPW